VQQLKQAKAAAQAQALLENSEQSPAFLMAATEACKLIHEVFQYGSFAGQAAVDGSAAAKKAGYPVSKANALLDAWNPEY
jgi:hypothetical protein